MVRILERGSVKAIRQALEQQRYHVLYISCHARPGELALEDLDGREDRVSAKRFWEEVLVRDRGVPLVLLAGCSTALEGKEKPDEGEEALPGFAKTLVEQGVPAVLAMQAPVTDPYATALAGAIFEAFATGQEPEPLPAIAEARRALERQRLQDISARAPLPEWSTPALYAAISPQRLLDPKAKPEKLPAVPEPVLDPGVVVRMVGDFVGRRREERLALRDLKGRNGAGVVLHGIGGVGKSTLAANLMHDLAEDDWLLVSLSGPVDCDQLLEELGSQLLAHLKVSKRSDRGQLREIANNTRVAEKEWQERIRQLIRQIFPKLSLIFLFDNFEDNLDEESRVQSDLADLLVDWVKQPGRSRLLFTSRHPFALPGGAERRLTFHPLGPLSLSETRKLIWRLPGLDALPSDQLQRAYEQVGGHPRALEYLDALLRGGKARFDDIEERLLEALKKREVDDPSRWYDQLQGNFDRALAETITLAADDVLLDALLERLEHGSLARRLLFGAAVYRMPVDRVGLAYQAGKIVERPEDPERQQRMQRVNKAVEDAQAAGKSLTFPSVTAAAQTLGVPEADLVQHEHDLQEVRKAPIEEPEGLNEAIALLESLSLLSPVQYTDEQTRRYFVHRWTARALSERASADDFAAAHRRAAAYWRWRFDTLPQSSEQDVEDLLEARHHCHAAGDVEEALRDTEHLSL
jgi:hypothetical protein